MGWQHRHRSAPVRDDPARRRRREGGWTVRLRFLLIASSFASAWWFGYQSMRGRVDFGPAAALVGQAHHLAGPQVARPASADHAPVTSSHDGVVAQEMPTTLPTAAPTTIPEATATTAPSPTATESAAPTNTPNPEPIASATATPTLVQRSSATPTARSSPQGGRAAANATGTAEALAGPRTVYIVQAGDTLTGIARRYNMSTSTLAEFNHLQAPYHLIQGSRLYIPAT